MQANLVGDDLKHWKGTIFGPVSSLPTNFLSLISWSSIDESSGSICWPVPKNEWVLTQALFLFGLKSDTCYAEGTFIIDIVIPPDYPFKPPKVSLFRAGKSYYRLFLYTF